MKRDTQSLLKRRERLNERNSLTEDDIQKIFKDRKYEAINCFDWTELICNETAFCILEEVKKQLQTKTKEESENDTIEGNQCHGSKDKNMVLLGQARIIDGQNQILKQINDLAKTIQELKDREMEKNSGIMDGLDQIAKKIRT